MAKIPEEVLLGMIANAGGGGGGSTNYNDLTNKPQIGGVTLSGNKSASDLGLADDTTVQGILDGQSIDSFGDVEIALNGKQSKLTAGDYIDIDGNEISVNRDLQGDVYTYTVSQGPQYGTTVTITKKLGDTVLNTQTYDYASALLTVDDAFTIGGAVVERFCYTITSLRASTENPAGSVWKITTTAPSWSQDFMADLSGYKLVIKSEMDTAIATKADLTDLAPAFSTSTAYTVGQYVSYDGNLYKCTSAHSAGAWVAGDFTLVAVGSELESKQNASGNSTLTTTDKTIVGAINEVNSNFISLGLSVVNGKLCQTYSV